MPGDTNRHSIFETHFKSNIVMFSFFLTTWGWFAWLCFLSAVFAPNLGTYNIRNSFTQLFGDDVLWWATVFIVLGLLGLFEIVIKTVKRYLLMAGLWKWPPWTQSRAGDNIEEWDLELWQELEQNPAVQARLKRMARDEPADEEDDLDLPVVNEENRGS